jgi:hypothetical protein
VFDDLQYSVIILEIPTNRGTSQAEVPSTPFLPSDQTVEVQTASINVAQHIPNYSKFWKCSLLLGECSKLAPISS